MFQSLLNLFKPKKKVKRNIKEFSKSRIRNGKREVYDSTNDTWVYWYLLVGDVYNDDDELVSKDQLAKHNVRSDEFNDALSSASTDRHYHVVPSDTDLDSPEKYSSIWANQPSSSYSSTRNSYDSSSDSGSSYSSDSSSCD